MQIKHTIRICLSGKCRGRGADRIASALDRVHSDDTTVEQTSECMGYCGLGPNVAVNGNILHSMHPDNAEKRVREEIKNPSPRVHGLGSRSLDDLDDFLDNL